MLLWVISEGVWRAAKVEAGQPIMATWGTPWGQNSAAVYLLDI